MPFLLLVTVVLIHAVHKPWWWYYEVHFAIPVSMLGSVGVDGLWWRIWNKNPDPNNQTRLLLAAKRDAAVTLGAAVLSLWLGFQLPYLVKQLSARNHDLEREDADLLGAIHPYAPRTQWVFARGYGLCYAFREGLVVPPELTVISKKRLWSHQTTESGILKTVQRYQPELLILPKETESIQGWRSFLQANYTFVHHHPLLDLFVLKSLHPKAPVAARQLIRKMGL